MRKSTAPGQLFSLDGMRGRDLLPAMKRFLSTRPTLDGGFSTWDASGIFYELHGFEEKDQPSARTLVLLYAADLHFRLRWQIEPALELGQTVIAAPYVETGIAFGLGNGIPRRWLTEVFRFAPKPTAAFWMAGKPTSMTSMGSFLDFCGNILPDDFYETFGAHFSALERRGKCRPFQL